MDLKGPFGNMQLPILAIFVLARIFSFTFQFNINESQSKYIGTFSAIELYVMRMIAFVDHPNGRYRSQT